MKTYEIEQTATAVILWTGEASTESAALDAYARDVGYGDFEDLEDAVGSDDGVQVREVT